MTNTEKIKILERLLEQSLNYLGLLSVDKKDAFKKDIIQKFVENSRKVLNGK